METKDLLKIGFIQSDIEWEKTDANLIRLSAIINSSNKSIDILILPEMFHCGFTMKPMVCAEQMNGTVITWMKKIAKEKDFAICGSVVVRENDVYYNRFVFVQPDGYVHKYDKRHLFRMAQEPDVYNAGNEQVIIEYLGWRIKPLICYDLRFPVWSRNRNDYDVLFYVANWPKPRRDAWNILLQARAIENQCYVVGVNRIGADQFTSYAGDSAVIDAKGHHLYQAHNQINELCVANLDLVSLMSFRQKFPVYLDNDEFKII